jgi:hypothetical protein
MWNQPYEDDTGEWDAANDQLPTPLQRKELVRATLQLAHLFPPGPEQSRLRQIARSLTFFEDHCPHPDEDPTHKPHLSLRGGPSGVGEPNGVVGIRLPSALLAAIERWAKAEGLSRSDAIRIWLQRAAVKRGRIGRH